MKWYVLKLSGDTSHDSYALNNCDVLICTPEKWDLSEAIMELFMSQLEAVYHRGIGPCVVISRQMWMNSDVDIDAKYL